MPVYDTDIEDVIDGEKDNMKDVVVVANDLCSLKIQTTVSIWIGKNYQEEYLKAAPMDDKLGFKTIKVRGRVIIMKVNLMQGIQMWMLRVKGTSEASSRTSFFQVGENDAVVPSYAETLTFSQNKHIEAFRTQKVPQFFGEVKLKGGWSLLEKKSIEYVKQGYIEQVQPYVARSCYPLHLDA
ncbi:hypothetical protein Tco_1326722 [Tanacetum coccineum]